MVDAVWWGLTRRWRDSLLPGEDPSGKKMGENGADAKSIREIIGVCGGRCEGRARWTVGAMARPQYDPHQQSSESYVSLVVRT